MKKAFYGLICHKKLQNVAHNYPKMQQIALHYSVHIEIDTSQQNLVQLKVSYLLVRKAWKN